MRTLWRMAGGGSRRHCAFFYFILLDGFSGSCKFFVMKPLNIACAILLACLSPFSANASEAVPAPALSQFDFAPSPAIWKMSDEDTTIYMFGTVHLLPKGLKWRTNKFDDILSSVDELVVETSDADFDEFTGYEQVFENIFENRSDLPLFERVNPENRDVLEELATYLEMPLVALDIMPTWTLPFLVYFKSIEEGEQADEYGYQYGVETILEAEFTKQDKAIISIEDPAFVLNAMSNMPDDQQIIWLDQMLSEWRKNGINAATDTTVETAPDGNLSLIHI